MTALPNSGDWRDKRCLVTGATGFIGTALCRRLAALGADVWAGARQPRSGNAKYRWIACDVTVQEQVAAAVRDSRPDVVFHLASMVTGARTLELVLPLLHSNLTGFVNVAIASAEFQCPRIVGVGSLQEPDQTLFGIPSSPYAAAKYAANAYARMLAEVFKLPVVIARVLMAYGPGQSDLTKLVPYVLSQLLAGRKPALSSGSSAFDWVYIDDVCDAFLAIATSENVAGRTIDVGTGELRTVLEVARGLAARLDLHDSLQVGAIPDRVGEPTRVADTAATKALTGWQARVGIEEGLDLTANWFRERFASGGVER